MEAGHIKAVAAIKAIHPDIPVGLSIAMIDDELETSGTDSSARDAKREECYGRWLRLAKSDDFMGVQNYERMHYDAKGRIDPPNDAVMNQFGNEVYPPSLANCVEYAHSITGKPIFVTEHGVNSEDDKLREWIIRESLVHLHATIQKGIPVLGYTHWSFLDNFEWVFGYVPKFGLCHVNRETMERTRKPSSFVLQEIASKNEI
jgi:beta-glucosidase